jgi:hypothetical protein
MIQYHFDMKTCKKCGAQKPLDDFYVASNMVDGRDSKCKECAKAAANKRRAEKLDEIRAYDRQRGNLPHRVEARKAYLESEAGRASSAAAKRKYSISNPVKTVARNAVANALRDGKLMKWPGCAVPECTLSPEAHHADYSRPLDVVWLCDAHHKAAHKLGREINRGSV